MHCKMSFLVLILDKDSEWNCHCLKWSIQPVKATITELNSLRGCKCKQARVRTKMAKFSRY